MNILGHTDAGRSSTRKEPGKFVKNDDVLAMPFRQTYSVEGASVSSFLRNGPAAEETVVEAPAPRAFHHAFTKSMFGDWASRLKLR